MSILLKNKATLLNATTTATASGSAVKLSDDMEGFAAVIKASSTGGTSPTFDMKIQHSHNGTDWFDLTTFTQITADTTEYKAIASEVLEYIRYDLTVGGTTPTSDLELYFCYNDKSKRE